MTLYYDCPLPWIVKQFYRNFSTKIRNDQLCKHYATDIHYRVPRKTDIKELYEHQINVHALYIRLINETLISIRGTLILMLKSNALILIRDTLILMRAVYAHNIRNLSETVLLTPLLNTSRPTISQYLLYLVVPLFGLWLGGDLVVPRTWTSMTLSRSFANNCGPIQLEDVNLVP